MARKKPKRWRKAQRHRCRMHAIRRIQRIEAHAKIRRARRNLQGPNKRHGPTARICAPAWLTLAPTPQRKRKNVRHAETARFVDALRQSFEGNPPVVCIDFSTLVRVVSDGMLLFYSELCSLIATYPSQPLRCIPSKDDTVNQVLEHLGVYRMLGYASGVTPSRDDVTTWKTESSEAVDGEKAGDLIGAFDYLVGERSKNMFRATTEAITNAVNHAYNYPQQAASPPARMRPRKWWMFCREDDNTLTIAVCDRGMGIPVSLPAKFPREHWWHLVARFTRNKKHRDAGFIRAAAEMKRTSTNAQNRGKGLPDVIRVADKGNNASVFIHSNRGILVRADGRFFQHEMKHSIHGTLIIWQLPIPEDDNHEQHDHH